MVYITANNTVIGKSIIEIKLHTLNFNGIFIWYHNKARKQVKDYCHIHTVITTCI